MTEKADLYNVLTDVRHRRKISRRSSRKYTSRASKLEVHRTKILRLKKLGASLEEIRIILSISKPKISASRSTIKSFIDKTMEEIALEHSGDYFKDTLS